jgi:hypothetical protein
LTEQELARQMWSPDEQERKRIEQHLRNGQVDSADVQAAEGGYLSMYRLRTLARRQPLIPPTIQEVVLAAWKRTLGRTVEWLGEAVMGPLVARLYELGLLQDALVRLVPGGWLGLLPLHAARIPPSLVPVRSAEGKGSYALDHFTFVYAPSAQALYHARFMAARAADSLLAVRYPDQSFQLADQAIQAALDVFPPDRRTPLLRQAARKQAVLDAFKEHAVLFFFTHGSADFSQPLESGLLMADGERLTLGDIFDLQSERARLAVLAACETGVPSDLRSVNEVVSLPTGLMQAGVPGVIGSLWSVVESSTAILMSIFFEEWKKNGLTPPEALRHAQQVVRDAQSDLASKRYFERYLMPQHVARDYDVELMIEDFTHPFYWAAFTYTGL